MTMDVLHRSYKRHLKLAERFRSGMEFQLRELMRSHSISLATPIESRVKVWSSIVVNVDRGTCSSDDVTKITDLVGLRLVLLSLSDASRAAAVIGDSCDVRVSKNKGDTYSQSEFGYQSLHLIVGLKQEWLNTPSFADCGQLCAEVQIRTVSQHNWAVASRSLDYKQESAAPYELRRSLHRLAAILELVDQELERISSAKAEYVARVSQTDPLSHPEIALNVDLLQTVLSRLLPREREIKDDAYSELFDDLMERGIITVGQLSELVKNFLDGALRDDTAAVSAVMSGNESFDAYPELIEKGLFYSWTGLVENMLSRRFERDWRYSS